MQKTNGSMDRAIPQAEIKSSRNKKLRKSIIITIVVIFIIFYGLSLLTPSIDRDDILISKIYAGPITEMLNASGLVVPKYEENLISPIQSNIEEIMLNQGAKVNSGATIMQLNTTEVQSQLSKLTDEYELKQNEKAKLKINLDKNLIDLETQYAIKALQIESMQKKVELETKLSNIGAGSEQNLDIAKLNLTIGKKEYDQLKRQIENQKQTLTVDLNEKDLQLKILKKQIDEIQTQLKYSSIQTQRSGILTWVNTNLGSQVQKGEIVAKVSDLSTFRIEGKASDIIADRIYNGQDVIVEANETQLSGKISSINPAIVGGSVTFYVEIDDQNNASLRSNLRVNIYIITSFKENTLVVKNGAFFNKKSNLNIYVLKGNEAIRKTVSVGLSNYKEVEIIGDINAGDEIIISSMEKYNHLETIEVNH